MTIDITKIRNEYGRKTYQTAMAAAIRIKKNPVNAMSLKVLLFAQ